MKVYDKSWHNALAAVKYMHNQHHYIFPSKKMNNFLVVIGKCLYIVFFFAFLSTSIYI